MMTLLCFVVFVVMLRANPSLLIICLLPSTWSSHLQDVSVLHNYGVLYAELGRLDKRLAASSTALHLLAAVIVVLMVFKPGA